MAFCGNCGTALRDGDRFCRSCGRPAPPNAKASPSDMTSGPNAALTVSAAARQSGVLSARGGSGNGVNIALGIVAAVLLVFFLLMIWAASAAQHNLDVWTGDPRGAPNPAAFGPPIAISIVAFIAVTVVLIVRLVRSDRRRRA